MKRSTVFVRQACYQLDLPIEELAVLLGDEEGFLSSLTLGTMQCMQCGISAGPLNRCDIYLDQDCCLYLESPCHYCLSGASTTFIDTTDLPDWQNILRHLLQQQTGLNSLGDE